MRNPKPMERKPHVALAPMDQEEVYHQLRMALAIALLIEVDDNDVAGPAASAIVLALHRARKIMETGGQDE